MEKESFLEDLTAQLQRRGVGEDRIGQIIGEIEASLEESGESPVDTFGPATRYAEEVAASDEQRLGQSDDDMWHKRTFVATALDEMETLKWAGKEGWELMDVGLLALFCRRPKDLTQARKWEYRRRTGVYRPGIKKEMAGDRWETCGTWVVFHYFKRDAGILENQPK